MSDSLQHTYKGLKIEQEELGGETGFVRDGLDLGL